MAKRILYLAGLWTTLVAAAGAVVPVARFSAGEMRGWEARSFAGETLYTLVETDGRTALRAVSQGTASGLYRKITVDLERTPFLNWSWKVNDVLQGVDERSRSGDDYPARVYVVVSGGALFWRTRALNYVWSSNQAPGSAWPNAYTDNVWMLAVASGATGTGRWVGEKRNVRDDLRRLFGTDVKRIDAVAIMSDTDDSGQAATAWYGDIYFSTE